MHGVCALHQNCSVCVVCRLLAENQTCSAVVQALKHAVEPPKEDPPETLPSQLQDAFSIAAIQLHTSNTSAGNRQINDPLDRDLISALLRAAVAFSTSQQLSEQLLACGVMSSLAVLLNRGGVRDHHTPLVVELLWNLLEAVGGPLSDAHAKDQFAAGNSTLCARHSQILKPRQKTLNEARFSGEEQDGDCCSDAEQELTFTTNDAAATDLDEQQQDYAQADREYGDATEEESPQELQQASIDCPADYSSSCAAGLEPAVDSSVSGDGATEVDAEAVAHSDNEGGLSDFLDNASTAAKSCLSGHSNRLAAAKSNTSTSPPSVVDDGESAEGDRSAGDETGSDESSSQKAAAAGLTDDTARVGLAKDVAAGIVGLLTDCFEHGYSTADKELRNTVLVVSGMLAESRQYRSALCCSEMLQQLVIVSTEPELGDSSTACFKVRCTFEQVQLVQLCCAVLCCAVLCCACVVLCCAASMLLHCQAVIYLSIQYA